MSTVIQNQVRWAEATPTFSVGTTYTTGDTFGSLLTFKIHGSSRIIPVTLFAVVIQNRADTDAPTVKFNWFESSPTVSSADSAAIVITRPAAGTMIYAGSVASGTYDTFSQFAGNSIRDFQLPMMTDVNGSVYCQMTYNSASSVTVATNDITVRAWFYMQ
jgi:hypothetical protein